MSVGAVLVGVSFALVVAAWLARPFRIARTGDDLDQVIDAWVDQVWAEEPEPDDIEVVRGVTAEVPSQKGDPILFCAQCGRHVGPEDRYCAACGIQIRGEA